MPDNNAVEISQAELDQLRGARALLGTLLDDPSEGLSLKRKVKKILPNARFPELDMIENVTKPYDERLEQQGKTLKELQDQVAADKKARDDAVAEQSLRQRLDSVRSQYGFTDDGMNAVVARMKDQSSPDVEGAAAFVAGQQPKPKPVATSGMFPSKMNLFGAAEQSEDPKIKALHQDPMHFLETEAIAVLDEFAQNAA